jgi:hypothetical protein
LEKSTSHKVPLPECATESYSGPHEPQGAHQIQNTYITFHNLLLPFRIETDSPHPDSNLEDKLFFCCLRLLAQCLQLHSFPQPRDLPCHFD